ncbi:tetratricopeptide repeat protein [soil metagenome]
MTTATLVFVALAASAALLVAVLLAWPLRRGSPRLFAGVVALVPVLAFLLYLGVGTPVGLETMARTQPETLAEAIVQLEADLQRDPRQAEGWRLLGRAHAQQQRFPQARDAFARAAALLPDDDDMQVEYAEARAHATPGRRFDADAVVRLRQVLARNPQHQRARWFLGIAQRQTGDDAGAAATWTPLLAQVDAGTAASLRAQIDAARAEAGLPPLPVGAIPTPAAATQPLRVRVTLDPSFAARTRLPADASVFVIARIPGGGTMPVAVERHPLRDLPLEVTLDDADAPMPTQKLSALREVELLARISLRGDATRQDDDVESPPVRVTLPAAAPVALVIGADP